MADFFHNRLLKFPLMRSFLKTMMSNGRTSVLRNSAHNEYADPSTIFKRLILAGGPPRSGTTLLAKILNAHDHIAAAIDNSVYENWGLYYYRFRTGLCARLRSELLGKEEVGQHLINYLYQDGFVLGIAPSRCVEDCPEARQRPNPVLGDELLPRQRDGASHHDPLGRRDVPCSRFQSELRLCLKSPEISFFLDPLATAFPEAKFVVVFRPAIEIAESMYRKGLEWNLTSFHKRWANEKDASGRLIAPPGVPEDWIAVWHTVSDFQRCAIYAASYLRALVQGLKRLPTERWFLYYHPFLVESPKTVLAAMGKFLKEDPQSFLPYEPIYPYKRDITPDLVDQFNEISEYLQITEWESRAHELMTSAGL